MQDSGSTVAEPMGGGLSPAADVENRKRPRDAEGPRETTEEIASKKGAVSLPNLPEETPNKPDINASTPWTAPPAWLYQAPGSRPLVQPMSLSELLASASDSVAGGGGGGRAPAVASSAASAGGPSFSCNPPAWPLQPAGSAPLAPPTSLSELLAYVAGGGGGGRAPAVASSAASAAGPSSSAAAAGTSSAAAAAPPSRASLESKTVKELKDMCRAAGLPCTANKAVLVTYLLNPQHYKKNKARRGGGGATGGGGAGGGRQRLSVHRVNEMFQEAGLDPELVSGCLKAGVQRGHVKAFGADGRLDLNKVLWVTKCDECSKEIKITVESAANQADYGGFDYEEGSQEGAGFCEDCECGVYLTGMCLGEMSIDSGKFHNHCTECPGFGICMGDYRMSHCERCHGHYFGGLFDNFPCNCREDGDSDDSSEREECSIM